MSWIGDSDGGGGKVVPFGAGFGDGRVKMQICLAQWYSNIELTVSTGRNIRRTEKSTGFKYSL